MAVEEATLRRFATEQFVQAGFSEQVDALVMQSIMFPALDLSDGESMLEVGDYVESRGWLALGLQAGYFDAAPLLDNEDQARKLAVLAGRQRNSKWPPWFRQFAVELGGNTAIGVVEDFLLFSDPGTLNLFQAALILAEEFREPLLMSLQRSLQFDQSPLDDGQRRTSGEEVFDSLETSRLPWRDTSLARSVSAMFPLIELLTAFDNLFPVVRQVEEPASEEHAQKLSRIGLERTVARLVAWRLNLRDEQTVRRLAVVSDAFFDVCEREFERRPELDIRWYAPSSHRELKAMLGRWRDRADPESRMGVSLSGSTDPGSSSSTPRRRQEFAESES